MEQNKPISKRPKALQARDESLVIDHLENHLRLLADHQGVGMPLWYYW